MPKGKNCPNCGAPYDPALNKCPYCGTIYFDMSCIDFIDSEPVYLKFKMLWGGKPVSVTQLVRPRLNNIHSEVDSVEMCHRGRPVARCCKALSVVTEIEFQALEDKDGRLMTVEEL